MSSNKRDNFSKHKSIWNRLFFSNSYEKMKFTWEEIDKFWLFVEKYFNSQIKTSNNNNNNRSSSIDQNEKRKRLGAKLIEKLSSTIPDEWIDIEFMKSKLKELNCQHYIDSREIYEFRDILLMFVDFNHVRKEKKIEKLRVFQENLPIYQFKNDIIETIKSYSVILIATG